MILQNLCDTCKKTFNNCNGDLEEIVFAGDIFKLPDITITQLDCVVNCKGYKFDKVIDMTESINTCDRIINKLEQSKEKL